MSGNISTIMVVVFAFMVITYLTSNPLFGAVGAYGAYRGYTKTGKKQQTISNTQQAPECVQQVAEPKPRTMFTADMIPAGNNEKK